MSTRVNRSASTKHVEAAAKPQRLKGELAQLSRCRPDKAAPAICMQVVAPHVGFCVKTWIEPEVQEIVVYLNLCHHSDVPEAVARPV